jgi:hypothetical protein
MFPDVVLVVGDDDQRTVELITRKILPEHQILLIGSGSYNSMASEALIAAVESFDIYQLQKSAVPEYGHYRVNFRTGKPLRY